jgi:hypothetical protein
MSAQCEVTARKAAGNSMGFFERYLTSWVFLCIIAGITLGHFMPGSFQLIGRMEMAQVNLPVAILIWLMTIPMLLKIDFHALYRVTEHWRGIGVTLFVNWAVKPFSMALLAWLFIRGLFADWLPAEQIDPYIAGLIILAAAPCTAICGEAFAENKARLKDGGRCRTHGQRCRRPDAGSRCWLVGTPAGFLATQLWTWPHRVSGRPGQQCHVIGPGRTPPPTGHEGQNNQGDQTRLMFSWRTMAYPHGLKLPLDVAPSTREESDPSDVTNLADQSRLASSVASSISPIIGYSLMTPV